MADTPESLVYRGMEGTGAAQIFGREGNPMRAVQMRQNDIARKNAIKAEEAKLAKEKRDKRMWDMVNVDPEAAFQPFNQQVMKAADNHRKKIVEYFEQGGNPEDPSFLRASKAGWDEVNNLARRSNYIQKTIADTQEAIKKDPFLKQDYYFPKIWDQYMYENGNGKPLDKVDPVAIQNVYVNDPMGFNENEYHKKFMEGLNELVYDNVKQTAVNNGILTEDIETRIKGSLYTPDENSLIGVRTDAKGKALLNMTPQLVNSYIASETAMRYHGAKAAMQGREIEDVVREQFEVHGGGLKRDTKASFSRDSNWYYDLMSGGRLKPDEEQATGRIFEHLENISNPFVDKNGNPLKEARPETREALGHLIGSKFGSGTIVEADVLRGTNKPGKTTFMGMQIDNSPNDQLVFKTKAGIRGLPKAEVIDLTDEGSGATLWNQFLNAGYMGKKNIAFDVAAEHHKINPRDLYKGREYKAVQQQREQESVNAWAKGENISDLTSKTYKGQPIVGVNKETSWGKFKALKLTLANGEQVRVDKEDYDGLTDLYRSDPPSPPANNEDDDMVSVINPQGKKGMIPKKNLDAAIKAGFKKAN